MNHTPETQFHPAQNKQITSYNSQSTLISPSLLKAMPTGDFPSFKTSGCGWVQFLYTAMPLIWRGFRHGQIYMLCLLNLLVRKRTNLYKTGQACITKSGSSLQGYRWQNIFNINNNHGPPLEFHSCTGHFHPETCTSILKSRLCMGVMLKKE